MTKRERWLTTGQVAAKLGWDERTIRRRCEAGDIPGAMRIGSGHWRIPGEWLDDVLGGVKKGAA